MDNYINFILLRNLRDQELIKTDKYLLPDYPISNDNLELIKMYRQQLRDFTNNNFIMPTKPDFIDD